MLIEQVKSKLNIISLARLAIFSICLSFLLYQTSSLFRIYLKYETSVDIEIRRSESNKYPAITVCFTNLYLIFDAQNLMLKNSSFNQTVNKNFKESKNKFESTTKASKEFEDVYRKYYLNITQFSSNYYILPKIDCHFVYGYQRLNSSFKCEQINDLLRSRTKSFECLTFFSEIAFTNKPQNISLDNTLKNEIWSEINSNKDLKQMVMLGIEEDVYNYETIERTLMGKSLTNE